MPSLSPTPGRDVEVLDADPGLRGSLAGDELRDAVDRSRARTAAVGRGAWDAAQSADRVRGGHGLLVLDGLLMRGVGQDRRFGAELLGPGDVLRPWEHDGEKVVLPFETVWTVLQPLQVALLDAEWAARMAGHLPVCEAIMARLHSRTLRLAATMAIARQPTPERRVLLLLWHFAERTGRVKPDGVHVHVPVPQAALGDMIGVGRQAVSRALGDLADDGTLRRDGRTFVLAGNHPPVA